MRLNGLTLIPSMLAAGYILLCLFLGNLVIIDEIRVAWKRHKEKQAERSRRIERFVHDYAAQLFPPEGGDQVIADAKKAVEESKRLTSKAHV